MRRHSCRALLDLCCESEEEKGKEKCEREAQREMGRRMEDGWRVESQRQLPGFHLSASSSSSSSSRLFFISVSTHTLSVSTCCACRKVENRRVEIIDRHFPSLSLSLCVSVGLSVEVGEASVGGIGGRRQERLYYFTIFLRSSQLCPWARIT